MSNKIQPIPRQDVHRICSGAVILDLATAVKELVENAVDAGATSVEVRLKDHGTELIEVADNGSGVKRSDRPALALKHHTSKLRSFVDLDRGPSSFGFRGEALSSLCAVAAEVSIVTRCDDDDDDEDAEGANGGEGARLSFDRSGALVASAPAPRARGTTVAVRRLFEPLPVRRRELLRTARREGARVVSVLQGYAVAVPRLRLVASDQRGGGARAALLQSPGGSSATARSVAAALWGPKVAASLVEVDTVILGGSGSGNGEQQEEGDEAPAARSPPGSKPSSSPPSSSSPSPSAAASPSAKAREEASDFFCPRVVGLISSASAADKAGVNSNNAERQFFSVNGRPVDLPRAGRVLNECWRALGSPLTSSSKPVAILDLRLPPRWCDVNVNPDKRRALLRRESALLEGLRRALRCAWEPSRATYRVHGPSSSSKNPGTSSVSATASAAAAAAAREAAAAFAAGGGSAREMMVAAAAGAKRAREAQEEEEVESDDNDDDDDDGCESEEGDEERGEEEEAEPGPPPPQRPRATAPPTAPSVPGMTKAGGGAAPSFAAFALGAANSTAAAAAPAAAASNHEVEEEEMEVEEEKEQEAPPPAAAAAASAAAPAADDEDATDVSSEEQEEEGEEQQAAAAAAVEEEQGKEEKGERDGGGDDATLPAPSPPPSPPVAAAPPVSPPPSPPPPPPPPPPETVLSVDMGALRAACARKRALLAERRTRKQQQQQEKVQEEEAAAAAEAEQKENRLASFSSSSRRFAAASLAASAAEGGDGAEAAATATAAAATAGPANVDVDVDDGTEAAAAAALLDGPARAELERVFKRSEFALLSRRVVGQFNLGFIVARLGDDLFVVDQHASDEKATFEALCANAGTLLSRQPLLAPVPLDLAPDEAAAVREHAEVFRANGFEIVEVVDGDSRATAAAAKNNSAGAAAAANSCGLALVAVPHSRGEVFGARDVADLAARLSGGGFGSSGADARFAADDAGKVVGGGGGDGDKNKAFSSRPLPRPPRVRAMLAMRACRSSIMVGRTLTKAEMERVVKALADLQSPWNCPHGRPTMRHLAVLPPVSAAAPGRFNL